ncbi:MAG: hypothetical protein II008_02385 [Oscillospiraceae bacterium]|nr:hypothetical protein [Oscillospiraceae bacterium]
MKEDEQATGGYVIAGKPYIIGDGDGDWGAGILPQMPKKPLEITNEIHAPTKEDLVEAAINHFRAVILDAEKE